MRRILLSLTAAALLCGAAAATSKRADACSLAGTPVTDELVRSQAEHADLIVAGAVVAEHPADSDGHPEAYVSTIAVAATLKGQPLLSTVDVGPVGYLGPDCSGGPELRLGERVLLFLRDGSLDPASGAAGAWNVSVALGGTGKYVLEDGQARYDLYGLDQPALSADALIQLVADTAGSDPDQAEVATRFAHGEDIAYARILPASAPAGTAPGGPALPDANEAGAADPAGTSPWTRALAVGGIALLGGGFVVALAARSRRRPH